MYTTVPNSNDYKDIDNFQEIIDSISKEPWRTKFVSGNIQPLEQKKNIAEYTNAFAGASSTCDSAIDYIVFDTRDCPVNANTISTG